MKLTEAQATRIRRWVNIIESGKPEGDYGCVVVYRDGKGGTVKQLTLGAAQTTEAGDNVRKLVTAYLAEDREGLYDAGLSIYLRYPPYQLANNQNLAADLGHFIAAFRQAATDPDMRKAQDRFFDERYFQPALKWCEANGFTHALSMLVVYDSFIHSGGIPSFLRKRFMASPADEKAWVASYVETRHQWLKHHSRPLLRKTIYRTTSLLREIERKNWSLSLPIPVQGASA